MTREELYELLDIESGEDFQYFENLAELMECGEELEYEDVLALVEEVDKETLAELIQNYFDEITDFIPGSEGEVFGILDNVQRALVGLCRTHEEGVPATALADELERFRRWYSIESRVVHRLISEDKSCDKYSTLKDALVYARMEKLDGEMYIYDFSQCYDYALDEYVMSIGDVVAAELAQQEADEADDFDDGVNYDNIYDLADLSGRNDDY